MEDLLAYLHFVVLPQVVDALIIGVALALVALGLTMIFGLLDLQLSNIRDMLFTGFWLGAAVAMPASQTTESPAPGAD